MRWIALVTLAGCTTHHHLTIGPTTALVKPAAPAGSADARVGIDASGELSAGEDTLRLVVAGAARAGHGIAGGGLRAGLTLGNEPRPLGIRGTFTAGPAWLGGDAVLDLRVGLGVDYGVITGRDRSGDTRTTFGTELFLGSVGTGADRVVMVGLGLSVGAFDHDDLAIAAYRPAE